VIAPSRKRQAVVMRRRQDPALDPWRGVMPKYLSALGAALACGLAFPALAQQELPATLAGHTVMPAESFIDAPADAPADLKISGKYTTSRRVDALGTVTGKSAERPTGVALPFRGQPLQGHSGVKWMADGTCWILTDNGFGSKAN